VFARVVYLINLRCIHSFHISICCWNKSHYNLLSSIINLNTSTVLTEIADRLTSRRQSSDRNENSHLSLARFNANASSREAVEHFSFFKPDSCVLSRQVKHTHNHTVPRDPSSTITNAAGSNNLSLATLRGSPS
jgi:hypothetical protein